MKGFTKKRASIAVAIIVLIIVAGVGAYLEYYRQPTSTGLTHIIFKMDYLPKGQHVPYWVAIDQGFFRSEGLDVTIMPSQGSQESLQFIATGKVNFTIVDMFILAQAIAKDPSLTGVRSIAIQSAVNPLGFVYVSNRPINSIRDVVGLRIGESSTGAETHTTPILLSQNGIDPDKDVTIIPMAGAAEGGALAQGQVDILSSYLTSLPQYNASVVDASGGKLTARIKMWTDLGMDYYAHSIVTTDAVIKQNPDLVKRFLLAIHQATLWAVDNPDQAAAIMHKYVPDLSLQSISTGWKIAQYIMADSYVMTHGLGYMDPQKVQYTLNVIKQAYGIDVPAADTIYTNAYLSGVMLPAGWQPPYTP
jgi:NitT/TauT family transport system substrate-binding protein